MCLRESVVCVGPVAPEMSPNFLLVRPHFLRESSKLRSAKLKECMQTFLEKVLQLCQIYIAASMI